MSKRVSITTIDNPFDPIEDFASWFDFDVEKGYYTCSKLARISNVSDDMTQIEEDEEVERAIDRLIELDPLDLYRKVIKEDNNTTQSDESNSGEGS
ncbi:MAG: hypothetical protein PUE66_01375 [Erysipelotrichaceae bacterium]|nr:hypothetical protein [Erysipelotrichaceae bacterium]